MSRSLAVLLFLFALPLAAQTATIHGVVKDGATNQPIAGVSLQLFGQTSSVTKTASDGTYSFSVAPGRWYLSAGEASGAFRSVFFNQHPCGGPNHVVCVTPFADPIDLTAGETRTIDFVLPAEVPFGTFSFAPIRSAAGNNPISVSAIFVDPRTHARFHSAPINGSGQTKINLPPHDYLVMSGSGTLHGLPGGATCLDPCPWLKTPVSSLQAGSTIDIALVHPVLDILDVTPDHGPAAGGTAVTVRGGYYIPTTVSFGSTRAEVEQQTETGVDVITPPGSGTVNVTADSAYGYSVTQAAAFHYVGSGESFLTLTTPKSPIRLAESATVTVELSPVRATATAVALTCSDPDLLTVPPIVTIPAGASRATFVAQSAGSGGGRITASANDAQSSSLVVQVVAPKITLRLPDHATGSTDTAGTITIDPPQPKDLGLYVSDPNQYVASFALVPAHGTTATFPLHDFYALGSYPRIRVWYPQELGGRAATEETLNAPPFNISSDSAHYKVAVGSTIHAQLQLTGGFEADTTYGVILFPTSKKLKISPQVINLSQEQQTANFTIEGLAPGVVTISGWNGLVTFDVEVVAAAGTTARRRVAGR